MEKRYSPEEIKRANIEYHAKMADSYDSDQPHFRPENVQRVDGIIKNLAKRYGSGSLLDIGCGTGFILNIAKKYFERVVGIDITQAMLDKVDLSSGNIELRQAESSHMPFVDESFDVCTAYSVLHHLPKLSLTFKEVFRCLKKGGVFYADADPNYYCWREVKGLRAEERFSDVLQREVDSIRSVPSELKVKHNLSEDIVELAEFHRFIRPGIKMESVTQSLKRAGFSDVDFQYQWFLSEGYVFHNVSEEAAKHIANHLRKLLPLSRCLFKYVSFIARKQGVLTNET